MSRAIVLMTALVPTIGHKFLIDFASGVSTEVHVIVSGRSKEPTEAIDRIVALVTDVNTFGVQYHQHFDDYAPQNPGDGHPDFWGYWKAVVASFLPGGIMPEDIVIASEGYGKPLAEALGCHFMPCDIARSVVPVSGTSVRHNLGLYWPDILPTFRKKLAMTVTTFGPESVGKTTMAKWLAGESGNTFVPEWAREYLETVGPEVTPDKMDAITLGQYAIMQAAKNQASAPIIFQDTDLLSTIGYYKLWSEEIGNDKIEGLFAATKSDLYIVMNDQISFTPDILRYGGDRRESDNAFWIDLLEEYNCNYYVVKSTDITDQRNEIWKEVDRHMKKIYDPIQTFRRE